MSHTRLLAIFAVVCSLSAPLHAATTALYDYTSDDALKTLSDEGSGVQMEKTTEHAPAGASALKFSFPEKGGKIVALPPQTDWSGYDYLVIDIFNPSDQTINLQFEAADKPHAAGRKPLGSYKERCMDNTLLAPGNNTVKFRISHAWTCEVMADRVDTRNMAGFMLWLPQPVKPVTLTFGPMILATADQYPDTEARLFDFEDPATLADWANLDLADATAKSPPSFGDKTHPLQFELSGQNATSGKHSLKITSSGGDFPTIATAKLPVPDFTPYKSFEADITAPRECIVIFRVLGEKSARGSEWGEMVGRWEKACLLKPGLNHVSENLAFPRKIVSFEIALYHPRDGESVFLDNIRLSKLWSAATTPYRYRNPCLAGERIPGFPALDKKWTALGVEGEFANPEAFAQQFKGKFPTPDKPLTVADVESQFKQKLDDLKAAHPNAVLAIFRQGDKGFDPKNSDSVYDGWKDASLWGHDPPAVYMSSLKSKPGATSEVFLRRRATLTKVDLATIPNGSNILAAQFVITRTNKANFERNGPGLLVAEACNRPFDPAGVTCFEYAKDKFWNEVAGMEWRGEDPDFLSLILAHGPSHLKVIPCDFTNAVNYWTDGAHKNYGFAYYTVYSVLSDYITANNSRAPALKDRPALMVIYEPK